MFGLVLQVIVAAAVICQGLVFLGQKKRKANRRREEIRRLVKLAQEEEAIAESQRIKISDEERLAKEDGQTNFEVACSLCYCTPTTTSCVSCHVSRYCSGKCQIIHWRQGHRDEFLETKLARDVKAIRSVGEPPKVINHHEKANYEADEPRNDKQPSIPDAIINKSSDSISFTILEDVLGSASEEEKTNPNPLFESSEERVRHLEEELAKSKKEISLLKSECSNWSARTSFISRRLSSLMRESDENQIAEQLRIAERSREDQHLRKLGNECAGPRRELLEEQERVRRLKLQVEEITRNSIRKVEEVRVVARRKQEKYIQMLEISEEARVSERIKQEENIQLLRVCFQTECAELRRELEQERTRRLQLEQDEEVQIAKRKAEKLSQELADARENVEHAENGRMKARRELEEERELVRLLKMECEEIRQSSMRQMEKKEQELTNALNDVAAAGAKLSDLERELNSFDDEACAICLTNEKDVAFGCGHMTCGDCMLTISKCHICRKPITSRLRLFPG